MTPIPTLLVYNCLTLDDCHAAFSKATGDWEWKGYSTRSCGCYGYTTGKYKGKYLFKVCPSGEDNADLPMGTKVGSIMRPICKTGKTS